MYKGNLIEVPFAYAGIALAGNQLFIGAGKTIHIFAAEYDRCDFVESFELPNVKDEPNGGRHEITRLEFCDQNLHVLTMDLNTVSWFKSLTLKKEYAGLSFNNSSSIKISAPVSVAPPLTIQANQQGQFLRLQLDENTWWDLGADRSTNQLIISSSNGTTHALNAAPNG